MRRLALRLADSLGGRVLPAGLDDRSLHKAYLKLWISLIIKRKTLSNVPCNNHRKHLIINNSC